MPISSQPKSCQPCLTKRNISCCRKGGGRVIVVAPTRIVRGNQGADLAFRRGRKTAAEVHSGQSVSRPVVSARDRLSRPRVRRVQSPGSAMIASDHAGLGVRQKPGSVGTCNALKLHARVSSNGSGKKQSVRIWSHRYQHWRDAGWQRLPRRMLYREHGLVNLVGLIPFLASRAPASS